MAGGFGFPPVFDSPELAELLCEHSPVGKLQVALFGLL